MYIDIQSLRYVIYLMMPLLAAVSEYVILRFAQADIAGLTIALIMDIFLRCSEFTNVA